MAFRVRFDVVPEFVKPKLEDLVVDTISTADLLAQIQPPGLPTPNRIATAPYTANAPVSKDSKGYNWQSWAININLQDVSKVAIGVKNFLEVVDKIQNVMIALLKFLRILNSDLKSLSRALKFLVKTIIKNLKEIIEGLQSTGIYIHAIFPNLDPTSEDYTFPIYGGFSEFISTVNHICINDTDPDRPRFSDADRVGGFVVAMIGGLNDPQFIDDAIFNFGILSKLFKFQNPFPSKPINVRAIAGFYPQENNNVTTMVMGVKISWEAPDGICFGFDLYRSEDSQKVPRTQ